MGQIVHTPVEAYLDGLHPSPDAVLDAIGTEGRAQNLPLVQPASARLLRSLVIASGARRVLELGTCIGYSAIWMAHALPEDGLLITLEAAAARAEVARDNIERAGLSGRISVIVGDARPVITGAVVSTFHVRVSGTRSNSGPSTPRTRKVWLPWTG